MLQPGSEFVLATGNPGKLRELQAMLDGAGYRVRSQAEFDVPDAEETGTTFVENAIIKARHAAALTGLPAVADDSGIAVDALGGAPGVYSARYAGAGASDQANLDKLLEAMRDVPRAERGCRFHCVMAFMRSAEDPTPLLFHGIWEGELLATPRGENGFGYDPLFLVPEHGVSSAELAPAVKNRISHRGRALVQLVAALRGAGVTSAAAPGAA